jgi:hypothetical protein
MLSTLKSPDERWDAVVQEEVCSDGAFVTTVAGVIQLVPHGQKLRPEDDVFAAGYESQEPRPRWTSPSNLEITVPNLSAIGVQKQSHEGVAISIKFEPDAPVARERFWREHR